MTAENLLMEQFTKKNKTNNYYKVIHSDTEQTRIRRGSSTAIKQRALKLICWPINQTCLAKTRSKLASDALIKWFDAINFCLPSLSSHKDVIDFEFKSLKTLKKFIHQNTPHNFF